MIERIRNAWAVLRYGQGEVIFRPEEGEFFDLPTFDTKGPVVVGVEGKGRLSFGDIEWKGDPTNAFVEWNGKKWVPTKNPVE